MSQGWINRISNIILGAAIGVVWHRWGDWIGIIFVVILILNQTDRIIMRLDQKDSAR